MTSLPRRCVLDASVLIKLFATEVHSALAHHAISALLASDADAIAVPDLAFIECANILRKKVRRGEATQEDADASLRDLSAMELPATPTAELADAALSLACRFGITAYDACYVALADRQSVPLLTADDRLAARLADSAHAVCLPADLPVP